MGISFEEGIIKMKVVSIVQDNWRLKNHQDFV